MTGQDAGQEGRMSKRVGKYGGRIIGPLKTAANSVRLAQAHHKQHGDMGGRRRKTCLLMECALHYPKEPR